MSSDNSKSKADRLCGLCNETVSKYCCPRCEVFYCSLDCYKCEKHSQCSESFYRECVNEELSSHNVDDASKQKMIDILKKMHEQDVVDDADILDGPENIEDDIEEIDSDDCSEIDLHTRIKDLNLDNPDALWNALTEDERNEFEAMLSGGDVGAIIPQWEPWWMYRKEKELLEEVNETKESVKLTQCPDIKSVPKFSSLTSNKPPEAIRYNMANVLAAYAFTARYFNGEIEAVEAATYLLDISTNLNSNANFEDADIAVESVVQRCLQSEHIHTDKGSLDVMKKDVYLILQGPSDDNNLHYSKSAFSHLIQIFTEAKSKFKSKNKAVKNNGGEFYKKFPEHGNTHLPELDVSKVKKVVKKLEYYLSFLNSCDNKSDED